jgi:hypothetical protein
MFGLVLEQPLRIAQGSGAGRRHRLARTFLAR